MKIKVLLLISLFTTGIVLLNSCKKKEYCETFNTGKITFENNHSCNLLVELNDTKICYLTPTQSHTLPEVTVGDYIIQAYDGYDSNMNQVAPITVTITKSISVTQCIENEVGL